MFVLWRVTICKYVIGTKSKRQVNYPYQCLILNVINVISPSPAFCTNQRLTHTQCLHQSLSNLHSPSDYALSNPSSPCSEILQSPPTFYSQTRAIHQSPPTLYSPSPAIHQSPPDLIPARATLAAAYWKRKKIQIKKYFTFDKDIKNVSMQTNPNTSLASIYVVYITWS